MKHLIVVPVVIVVMRCVGVVGVPVNPSARISEDQASFEKMQIF